MDRESMLIRVKRPGRYLGGEAGRVLKEPGRVRLSFALCFPEVYEIAMSHLGLKVLYGLLAEREDVACERVFCPWTDLMDLMDQEGIPPWSLESRRPLGRFDVIGFSLAYELTYSNMLHMLRLAGVPLSRVDRGPEHPLVIAGGPCMVNPEPLADFLDLAVVGEAEDLLDPLMDLFIRAKERAWPRERLYEQAARIEGIYIPSFYTPLYEGGRLREIRRVGPGPDRVRRRLVADLELHPPPVSGLTPLVKPVHDRVGVEIARGCTRGCRFCQAGYIYRPARERSPGQVRQALLKGLERTGLEEAALLSLSAGDYSCIEDLALGLMDELEPRRINLSLPSLRMDSLSDDLAAQLKRVRRTGFTLAPEAGSQHLRKVINKDLSEEQILATAGRVYGLGWQLIKLYFMVGLPTESDDDLGEIGRLCGLVVDQARRAGVLRGKKPVVHASLGTMVPKPHTPVQWEEQISLGESLRRLDLVRDSLRSRLVRAKWNSPQQSLLEGVISRGDRRLGRVLKGAMDAGARFDGWSEELDLAVWRKALAAEGLSIQEYLRARDPGEVLPWDHIDVGVSKEFLLRERERGLRGRPMQDCRHGSCTQCGVCDFETIQPRLARPGWEPAALPVRPKETGRHSYRFCLEKTGPARFMGHIDMITQLVRAFMRARVSLAFTQGFHPHPLVKTDSALPLGVESLVENLQITLVERISPGLIEDMVNPELPQGLRITGGRPALPKEGLAEPDEVTYLIRARKDLTQEAIQAFSVEAEKIVVRSTPKGKRPIDLKRSVLSLRLDDSGLTMVVGRKGGRPKPAEVLIGVFGLSREDALAVRAIKVGAVNTGGAGKVEV